MNLFFNLYCYKLKTNEMKTKIVTLLFVGALAMFVSCKKAEKGDTGPAGTNGTNGLAGVQGNANVKIYNYGTTTLSATTDALFKPVGLTAQQIDSSLIMVYYSESAGQWNVANGLGPGGSYATIQYSNPWDASINVYLRNADGTTYSGGTILWQKVRVVIVPTASVFRTRKVDYTNYADVARAYHIKE
jgi:hypothetical protein